MKKTLAAGLFSTILCASAAEITDLRAEYRDGQVFLQWKETGLPPSARLTVWGSPEPITMENLSSARKLADHLNQHSARDWWCDISSFLVQRTEQQSGEEIFAGAVATGKEDKKKERGFIIRSGGKPLDPRSGLHVHTVSKEELSRQYYAVSWNEPGKATRQLLSLSAPVDLRCEPVRLITIKGKELPFGCAAGKPLLIELHGRGGGVGVNDKGTLIGTHLFFTSGDLGWREGLPVKCVIAVQDNMVRVKFLDRTWIGRKLTPKESPDSRDYVPAISSFWLAYNRNIGISNEGPDFQVDNYTEKLLLALIDIIQRDLGTDPACTYLSGGSMGGTGSVQMALHFPKRFAAVRAYVPVYSYTWKKCGRIAPSATRLVCSCGFFTEENPARLPGGRDLLEYANGERQIAATKEDTPPIFATNGRQDTSIPWVNNPGFYRAADKAKQAFQVYWNNGTHAMTADAPTDMQPSDEQLFSYRLDRAFAAFSSCSDNRNCGNGDPDDGDLVGWINRGTSFEGVEDSEKSFAMKLRIAYPGATYPIISDVTFRRRQAFSVTPGENLKLFINGKEHTYTVPADGLLTVKTIRFSDGKPVMVKLTK